MKGLRWSILCYFSQTEMTLKLLIQSLSTRPPPLRRSGSSLLRRPAPRDQDVLQTCCGNTNFDRKGFHVRVTRRGKQF